MGKWDMLADAETVKKTVKSLGDNGIEAFEFKNRSEAIDKFHELIPGGSEVFNNSSTTLDMLGLSIEIMESGKYVALKKQLMSMDQKKQGVEMKKMGSVPDYSVGSVHAVTIAGEILIASASGSQIPSYAFGAGHVVWVVGTQKIVKDIHDAFARLYEYTFPLENERAKKVYGSPSSVNKILIVNKEPIPKRTKLIFIHENLGF